MPARPALRFRPQRAVGESAEGRVVRPPLALVVIEDPDLRREVDAAVAVARGRSVHAGDEAALLRSLDRQSVSMVFAVRL